MRCPICKKPVDEPRRGADAPADVPSKNPRPSTFPFCSERCKLVDLGRWLDGKYRVPVVEEDGDESTYLES